MPIVSRLQSRRKALRKARLSLWTERNFPDAHAQIQASLKKSEDKAKPEAKVEVESPRFTTTQKKKKKVMKKFTKKSEDSNIE